MSPMHAQTTQLDLRERDVREAFVLSERKRKITWLYARLCIIKKDKGGYENAHWDSL